MLAIDLGVWSDGMDLGRLHESDMLLNSALTSLHTNNLYPRASFGFNIDDGINKTFIDRHILNVTGGFIVRQAIGPFDARRDLFGGALKPEGDVQ